MNDTVEGVSTLINEKDCLIVTFLNGILIFFVIINYLSFINQSADLIGKVRKGQEIWEHYQKVREDK